ncbi:hypothetical protein CONCODRAFT_74032 [Conidiobolus coronatus NRRL 28638]|uniref:HTH CENPB-type domain-containing protein n=1 Tax=Conidiobolus coronatus (strain ATCC 28846 / CBS 209.66 / NRRL 28638) TaxID=796925 RepID=A0A137NSY1_CONC2|nr:hypothetical protein CONCODRAFT_74032 [Conidiobolus coronatus NRRL 28638]|eukprot:KXN65895.1 hypothetical protein CONCODRAFT_74032 [Conidiobolus coronatus NRRL 28638]
MEGFDSVIKLNNTVTATTNSVGNSSNGENITFNSINNNTNNTNANKITSTELNFSAIENENSAQKKEVKPRAKLSLQEKVKLCQYSLDHPNLKHTQLAQLFKIKRSTVSSILSNTQKWQNLLFESENSNDPTVQFRLRPPRFPQLELELKDWYLKTKQTIKTIPDSMIVREAKSISKRLDIPDKSLKFSNGWLVRIKKKFNALVEDKQIDLLQTTQGLDFPILDDNFLTNSETTHHHHQLGFDLGQLTTMPASTANKQPTPASYYIPPEVGLNSGQVFLDYFKQLEGENSENAQLISNLLQLAKKKTSWEVGKTFLKLLGETNQNCNTEELKLLERLINGSG